MTHAIPAHVRTQGAQTLSATLAKMNQEGFVRPGNAEWFYRAPAFLQHMLMSSPELAHSSVFWKGTSGEILCEMPFTYALAESEVRLSVGTESTTEVDTDGDIEEDSVIDVRGDFIYSAKSERNVEEPFSWAFSYSAKVFGVSYFEGVHGDSLKDVIEQMASNARLHSVLLEDENYKLLASLYGQDVGEELGDYNLPSTAEGMLALLLDGEVADDEDEGVFESRDDDSEGDEFLALTGAALGSDGELAANSSSLYNEEEAARTDVETALIAKTLGTPAFSAAFAEDVVSSVRLESPASAEIAAVDGAKDVGAFGRAKAYDMPSTSDSSGD